VSTKIEMMKVTYRETGLTRVSGLVSLSIDTSIGAKPTEILLTLLDHLKSYSVNTSTYRSLDNFSRTCH
jgi:hypothetical protein